MTDHNPNYPLIGNRYESKDKRDAGRTIHVIGFATKDGYEIPDMYRVEVVTAPLNPGTVGRKYKVRTRTLLNERLYLEISR